MSIGSYCRPPVVLLIVALSVLAPAAPQPTAQQPTAPDRPTFRAAVNLVEVVAVVTDGSGSTIDDLTAEDFELIEDGTPRLLQLVRRLATDAPAYGSLPTASRPRSGTQVERLATNQGSADAPAFVLLLDDLDTSRRDAYKVIRAGEKAFASIPADALVSVLTTSGLGGSLLTLEPPGPAHLAQIRAFRGQLLVRAVQPGGFGLPSTSLPSSMAGDCMTGKSSLDCQDPTRAARRASAVAASSEILGRAGTRRKVLVWVTQTMGVSTIDPQGSQAAQRRALAAALGGDVTVYVLDPRENTGGGDDDPDAKRTGGNLQIAGGQSMPLEVDDMAAVPLTQITRETGGRYITMANNLGGLLGDIIEQNSRAYVLVYESPVSNVPGRHRIDVRVKRPGARVSARRGYVVDDAEPSVREPSAPPQTRLLRDTLLGSAPQGTLQLTVHAAPRFAVAGQGSVAISALLADRDSEAMSAVDVAVAAFDDEGRQSGLQHLRLEGVGAGTPRGFATELSLPRGRHQLRVAAATADGTRTALVITPIELAEATRDLAVSVPVILVEDGTGVGPTALRQFDAGITIGAQMEVAGRDVRDQRVAVRMLLADASGAVVRTADAVLDDGSAASHRRATAALSTRDLAAGRYQLTAEVTGANGRVVRQVVPIGLSAVSGSETKTGSLRHSVVARGPASTHAGPRTLVIRTEQEWAEFWKRLPTRQDAPAIDFSRATLFAIVGAASAQTGVPVVTSIADEAGDTVVTWRHAPPATPPPVLNRPFVVVALDRTVGPVRFVAQP